MIDRMIDCMIGCMIVWLIGCMVDLDLDWLICQSFAHSVVSSIELQNIKGIDTRYCDPPSAKKPKGPAGSQAIATRRPTTKMGDVTELDRAAAGPSIVAVDMLLPKKGMWL